LSEPAKFRVSSRVTTAILRYAAAQGLDVDALCRDLDVPRRQLAETRTWVDAAAVRTLWKRLVEATGDPDAPRKVGEFAVREGAFGALSTIMRLAGSPRRLLARIDRLAGYLDNSHEVKVHRVGTTSALIEVKPGAGAVQTAAECAFIRGLFAGLPTLWRLPPAQIEELSCAMPLDQLPPLGGRVYLLDDTDSVFSHPVGDPTDLRQEGPRRGDGTFPIGQVAYGATGCLFRLTWERPSGQPWWQRIFPNSAALADTITGLEKDLREIDEMYEEMHRASARLEQTVAERTAELERAYRETAALNEKLKRQAQLKSEFIADVSHELRTLITAIVGFADLLSSQIYGELNERQHAACERIASNTRTLLLMINDLLDLSKLQAGKMELVYEAVNLRELVDEAIATVAGLSEQKGLTVHKQIEPETPVRLNADQAKIMQMMLNLLSNAIKYTDRGHITVRLYSPEPGWVALAVEDTGRGVPEDELPFLFEEYYRARGEGDERPGTGLGLYITKKLAELFGGRVEVVSRVGYGSVFTVVLPLERRRIDEIEEIKDLISLDPERNRRKALIADSNVEELQLLALSLEAEGLQVGVCSDGRVLAAEIHRFLPDVLVLDPLLSHKDGWTTLQALRADPATAALPVILITEAVQSDLSESLGVTESITKPFDAHEVVAAVLRVLGLPEEQP
jgi:signal transduction histidine kinase/CheY-like chemotaxis protein